MFGSTLVMLEPMLDATGSDEEDTGVMISCEDPFKLLLRFLEALGGVEVDEEEGGGFNAAPLVAAVEAMRLSALLIVMVYGCE